MVATAGLLNQNDKLREQIQTEEREKLKVEFESELVKVRTCNVPYLLILYDYLILYIQVGMHEIHALSCLVLSVPTFLKLFFEYCSC